VSTLGHRSIDLCGIDLSGMRRARQEQEVKVKIRKRFWLQAGLSSVSGLLFAVTLLWHEWIELVFHVDPDNGNGSLEWLLVGILLGATISFGGLAVGERLRPTPVS
jgi:hypothetical protein